MRQVHVDAAQVVLAGAAHPERLRQQVRAAVGVAQRGLLPYRPRLAPAGPSSTGPADAGGGVEAHSPATPRALRPPRRASGAGAILNVGSPAGRIAYEGGAGYTAAKHGTQVVTETLRLELWDQPVRVMEIAPGMVRTDEFALVRFEGDQEKADAVYAGVAEPLTAEDVADAISWMVTRPPHVNIDELVLRPRAQAAQHKVHREG